MEHSKHRKRIMARYERGEYLEDHELLEALLFYSRPRVNTNGIAHELIDTCGSLREVFYSNEERLKKVDGVGQHSARLIDIISEIMYRCNLSACDTSRIYNDQAEREKYLCALFEGACEEKIYMVMFGRTNRFIGCELIGEGVFGESEMTVVKAIEKAIRAKASSVMIAHNHPGGLAVASGTDIETAKRLNVLFSNSNIDIIGHYIVAGRKCEIYGDNETRKTK